MFRLSFSRARGGQSLNFNVPEIPENVIEPFSMLFREKLVGVPVNEKLILSSLDLGENTKSLTSTDDDSPTIFILLSPSI